MALIPCKECKKEVSTDAKVCPHCGVQNPTVTTKDMLIGVVVLVVLLFVGWSLFGGDDKEKAVSEAPTAVAQDTALPRETEKDLGMTPEAFRKAYNALANQVDKKLAISKLSIQKGEVADVFNVNWKGVSMVGSVNKSNDLIKEILLILGGENDGITPLVVFLSTTQALNPSVPKSENSRAVSEMIQEAGAGIEKGVSLKKRVGKLQYSVSANRITGLMFVISPL